MERVMYYVCEYDDLNVIEYLNNKIKGILSGIVLLPLQEQKKQCDLLYQNLIEQLSVERLIIERYQGLIVISDGDKWILGDKSTLSFIYDFLLLYSELPILIEFEKIDSNFQIKIDNDFKSSITQKGAVFLFKQMRQYGIIKNCTDSFLAEIISQVTGYSSKKNRQYFNDVLSKATQKRITDCLEKIKNNVIQN